MIVDCNNCKKKKIGSGILRVKRKDLIEKIGVSRTFLFYVFRGEKHFSWNTGKRFASACGVKPARVMDADGAQLREMFEKCLN